MSIQKLFYSPECHERLLQYMKQVFPHRSSDYLEWWLDGMRSAGESLWDKGIILQDGDNVIGCTTANNCRIMEDGKEMGDAFWLGNTIVSESYRGKGLSKMLYSQSNQYNHWFSVGITDIAWKIQPRIVKNFNPIKPVHVYVGVSLCSFLPLIREREDSIRVDSKRKLERIHSAQELCYPSDGRWTHEKYELVRDQAYIESRFFQIYRASQYALFRIDKGEESIGYVVVRPICYKKIRMLSIVDFRIQGEKKGLVLKAARVLARYFKLPAFIILTNESFPRVSFFPFVVKMKKELHCATSCKGVADSGVLITSADSDLDFVYYS